MRRLCSLASMIARLATRSALGGGTRTLVLLAAMSAVVVVCIVLMSFLSGLEATVSEAVRAVHGHVRVIGLFKAEPGPGRPALALPGGFDEVRDRLVRLEGVQRISARTVHRVELIGAAGALVVDLEGVDLDDEPLLRDVLVPAAGAGEAAPERLSADALAAPRSLLVFRGQAERLGVDVGDRVFIRTRTLEHRQTAGVFTIGAVLGDRGLLGEVRAFVQRAALNELIAAPPDAASGWFVTLRDPNDAKQTAARVHDVLAAQLGVTTLPLSGQSLEERRSWTATPPSLGTSLHISDWTEELDGLRWLLTIFSALGNAALFLMLIVLAIGITNMSFVAVQERRAEIGTLRAMGMGRTAVGCAVLLEMAALAAVSTLIGAVVGLGVASVLSVSRLPVRYEGLQTVLWSDTLQVEPDPSAALTAGVVLMLVSALSSVLPALAAARLTPIESMERGQ